MQLYIDVDMTPSPNEKPMLGVWLDLDGSKNKIHRVTGAENKWPAELYNYFSQSGETLVDLSPEVRSLVLDDMNNRREWPTFYELWSRKIRNSIQV